MEEETGFRWWRLGCGRSGENRPLQKKTHRKVTVGFIFLSVPSFFSPSLSLFLSFLSSLALVSTNASLGTDSCSSLINRANNARKASSHGCSPARPNLGCSCTSPGKRTRQVPFPSPGLALLSAQSAAACEPPNLTLCVLVSRPSFRNHRPTPQFTGRTPTP